MTAYERDQLASAGIAIESFHEATIVGIWSSAYGAAFVAHMERFLDEGASFDDALKAASAERAETIADHTVNEWIRWKTKGKP